MLNVLEYSVEFPTTGRSFANRIEFAPGLTAITGRNEAGKTVVLEMIGYCLFGKAALRGLASDYRALTASLSLKVGEKQVAIARSSRREVMTVDGAEHAVGAEAINKAVPALLGFGLDVFNIACAAQQGDIGALTEMKPTARRQMVEKLIGLDQLEGVEKDCRDEARQRDALASSLAMSVSPPEVPVRPDGYEDSGKLRTLMLTVEALERRRHELSALREPTAPPAPAERTLSSLTVGQLEQHEHKRQEQLQARARVEGQLAAIPVLTVTSEELEKAVLYRDYKAEVARRGPRPSVDLETLKLMEADWDIIDHHAHDDLVTCPECQHQFDARSGEAKAEVPQDPPLSRGAITTEFRRHQLWAEPLAEVEAFEIDNLEQQARAWESRNLRDELELALAVPQLEDWSNALREARAFDTALAVFESRMATYNSAKEAYDHAQVELAKMEDRSSELEQLRQRLTHAVDYERAVERYQIIKANYEDVMERSRAARTEGEGYSAGAAALNATRVAVKAELAPSLSRAASSLISLMTGGERRSVVVDHDFNVVVDGQPLQTLSGSGKSVVNLALRIGMGQVLTSRVLPIFLGDEIDAAMDNDRAGTTHATMQALCEYLTQVIIVTHKDIEADQTITLGT